MIKTRIDAVANAVRAETGIGFDYRLGKMCETPRAALRADEIAEYATFLSFGTNNLTQLTYGLSRGDVGRFMAAYLEQGGCSARIRSCGSTSTAWASFWQSAPNAAAGRGPTSSCRSAASTGATRTRSPFAAALASLRLCSPFRAPVARLAATHLPIGDRSTDDSVLGR